MRIVVASGKGGTGKTTVATGLALVAAERCPVRFLDCDVEAPNAGLFLHPVINTREEVGILVPQVDAALCTHCGKCAEVCQFHAIAAVPNKTLVFPDLCHGCGSCTLICPEQAISERLSVLGTIESGRAPPGIEFAQGKMHVGKPMAVPILRALKERYPASLSDEGDGRGRVIEIRDAPPGASCSVVETLRGADFALLVTEPTPFGLHDLKQVVAVARELDLPVGVAINRDGIGDGAVAHYCTVNELPILLRIPMELRIARALARGTGLIDALPEYRPLFRGLLDDILQHILRTVPA